MRHVRNAYKILVRKNQWKDHSEHIGVDERIILEWILGNQGGKLWIGRI